MSNRGSAGIEVLLIVLGIALGIYLIAVNWKIVKKSGDKGWKVLIPIYGSYVFYRAVDSTGLFWGTIISSVLSFILSMVTKTIPVVQLIFSILFLIISLVISVKFAQNTAHCFNKRGGFTVGLFFLAPIFLGILAFGSAQHYNGEEQSEY